MLFLVFQIGNDRYALPAKSVVEVVPLLNLKHLPHAPRSITGVFNYRGVPVPAIDLSDLTLGRAAVERMSTRIIVVNCPNAKGQARLLGLIAERATGILRTRAEEFDNPGSSIRGGAYLGPMLMDQDGTIQLIYEQQLLTEPVRERLFSEGLPLVAEGSTQAAT